MENNIKITDSIFAVVVPEDASEIKDTFANGVYYKLSNGAYDSIYFDDFHVAMNYKIIGTATLPDLQFDFELGNEIFENTMRKMIQKSIQDAGLLLVNPFFKPRMTNEYNQSELPKEIYYEDFCQWQQYESKVLKGKLLLIEKIK